MSYSVKNLKHLAVDMPKIDCTGDACTGDYIYFSKAVFIGTYPHSTFAFNEEVEGLIVADSYGAKKQQHTFSIEPPTGSKMLVKGRNLYRNGCTRDQWIDESKRNVVLSEKHARGSIARDDANIRKYGASWGY